jgi:hypothetical protein
MGLRKDWCIDVVCELSRSRKTSDQFARRDLPTGDGSTPRFPNPYPSSTSSGRPAGGRATGASDPAAMQFIVQSVIYTSKL